MNRSGERGPAGRSILLTLATMLGLAMGLSGCLQTASLPEPGVTPMEPPPLPPRRPAPPVGFAAQQPSFASQQPVLTIEQPDSAQQTNGARQPNASVRQQAVAGQPPSDLPIPGGLYRVQPGDTVYGIARRAGLPLRALIDANRLAPPYRLAVGRDLIVPRARVHVVKAGETVYRISRIHSVDRSQLTRINGIGPPFEIRVGQRLVLPEPGLRTELASLPNASASDQQQPGLQQQPGQVPAQQIPVPPQQAARTLEAATAQPPLPPRRPSAAPQQAARQPATPAPAPAVQAPRQTQTAAIPQPPPRAGGRFGWPLRGRILGRYGPEEGGRHNDGINIAAPRGAPIQAAENGVVAYVGSELRGYGQLVLVKHADGWVTAYAHADSVLVRLGDTVQRGQTIARVGSTGAVDQPQLHFEIRKGTNAVDPLQMLDGAA